MLFCHLLYFYLLQSPCLFSPPLPRYGDDAIVVGYVDTDHDDTLHLNPPDDDMVEAGHVVVALCRSGERLLLQYLFAA